MTNFNLKSIKYESIKSIFATIAGTEKISRADIATQTNLSLVTVGKIADALLENDIICQVKEIRPSAGRRAGVLSVNELKFSLIIDLTAYSFSSSVLNLRLKELQKSNYEYKKSLSYSENFNLFLGETLSAVSRKYDINDCIGIGIAVPGFYSKTGDCVPSSRIPELANIKISNAVKNYFPNTKVVIDSHSNSAAKYNVDHTNDKNSKNILYWFIGNDYISGAFSIKGELINGKSGHFCDFGSMLILDDLTLEDKLAMAKDQNECAAALTPSIYNVLKTLDPHVVIMEFDTNYPADSILPLIKELLTAKYRMKKDELPEFIKAYSNMQSSYRGLALNLREIWLDKIVFS